MGESQVYGPPASFDALFARIPRYRADAEEAVRRLPNSVDRYAVRHGAGHEPAGAPQRRASAASI
jgi:hypothetical protein